MSARYRVDRNLQEANGIGALNSHDRGSDSLTRDQDGVLSHTAVLSNRALNEFRFQASQRYNNIDPTAYSPSGTPAIARPSGNFGKATNLPQWRTELRFQFVDNYSITKSNHDLKFGTDVSVIRGRSFFPRTNDGSFTFATDTPFDPADMVRRIEAVDDAAVGRVVARWRTAPPTLVGLGPVGRLEDFERLRARLAG